MLRDTQVIEIHGNDGTSHLTAAENHVKKTVPGATIVKSGFGVGRCEHGNLLVEVTYEREDDRDV